MTDRDSYFMRLALDEARKAARCGEVPVGAILVCDDKIVGRGYNLREKLQDPTAHAEMIALREGARNLGSWRLEGCSLYVTLEPCPMCAGALIQARVGRLIYGTADPKGGAVESITALLDVAGFNHKVSVTGDLMAREAKELLQEFFRNLRNGRVSESG